MCSKMKGQLKSRFIVLNDDRVLPPPPQSGVAGVSHHRGRGRGGCGGRGTKEYVSLFVGKRSYLWVEHWSSGYGRRLTFKKL